MERINIYPNHRLNPISPLLMGHFVEQFPGNIPNGIFDPDSKHADEDGFRTDILQKMREAGVTQIRWAGNFSSHYHWYDGIGDVNQRPKKINFAWDALEDNHHGTAEFIKLCRKVGAEPVIGVNMGSGTAEEAMNWVEYCNGTGDTCYANLRRQHGYEEPFKVKYWCLGNEMYSQWQFGALTAQQYAEKAVHFAYAMKRVDPTIKLTAVGLETDPEWNFKVVEKLSTEQVSYAPNAGNYIDYISCHYYPIGNDSAFTDTDYYTRAAMGIYFHERTRLMRNAIENATDDPESSIKVVWDEWNPMGERDGSEFTLEMALWSALILNSYVKDSRYVEMANYTFFVGGNGPVRTEHDRLLLQPEFYLMKMYAEALGSELTETRYTCPVKEVSVPVDARWPRPARAKQLKRTVPMLDIVSSRKEDGSVSVFITNVDKENGYDLELVLRESDISYSEAEHQFLWNENVRATNTYEETLVETKTKKESVKDNTVVIHVEPHSINTVVIR